MQADLPQILKSDQCVKMHFASVSIYWYNISWFGFFKLWILPNDYLVYSLDILNPDLVEIKTGETAQQLNSSTA